jgi:hypothetical protein
VAAKIRKEISQPPFRVDIQGVRTAIEMEDNVLQFRRYFNGQCPGEPGERGLQVFDSLTVHRQNDLMSLPAKAPCQF